MYQSYNAEAKEVFNKVVNSYNVLSDEAQRKNHDAEIMRPRQPQFNQSQKEQRGDKNVKKPASHFKSHYYDHQ
jgi:DnaJ-class molecular chaperone